MSIRIVIDSSCDLGVEKTTNLGFELVPLKTIFGDDVYNDGVDLTTTQFYEKLIESDTLPTTSQPTPGEFKDVFERILANGDEIVCLCLSAKLSGTYQSAQFAVSALNAWDKVRVIDTESVTVGIQMLAERAQQMIDEGVSLNEIAETLDKEKKEVRIIALLDTLEYLRKGGRITAVAAAAGSLLSIKPVITIEEGRVDVLGKARGSKAGNNLLRKYVDEKGPIDFKRPFRLVYSGFSTAILEKYVSDSKEIYEEHLDLTQLKATCIGSTIGTHIGPGAIGVAFFAE